LKIKITPNKSSSNIKGGLYRRYFKRLMDVVLSFITIILLTPIMLVIAILVKIKLGSPVIFKQKRPGLNERIFTLYKFRTMTNEKDEQGELLPDSVRLTQFGRFLRSTSLDELPELFNILKGERGIIETTKKNADFSRVVTVNSISL
jgi:undecaprenyl phosphate N,N'-diacetylbacillosamine 1-phosphate transferase